MSDEYIEISACCYSDTIDVSVGFGIGFDKEDFSIADLGTDWIYEGLSESFWENAQDFEEGVSRAYAIVREEVANGGKDDHETFMKALRQVFGEFKIEYEIEGVKQDFTWDVDVNSAMYDMLPDVYVED